MNLNIGDKIRVTGYSCGRMCEHKYSCMGIIKNVEMEVVSIQPMRGPVVVKVGEAEYTIGYGMFQKLEYEIV